MTAGVSALCYKEGQIPRNKSSSKAEEFGAFRVSPSHVPTYDIREVGWASWGAATTVFPFSKSGREEGENDFVITQFRPAAECKGTVRRAVGVKQRGAADEDESQKWNTVRGGIAYIQGSFAITQEANIFIQCMALYSVGSVGGAEPQSPHVMCYYLSIHPLSLYSGQQCRRRVLANASGLGTKAPFLSL